LDVAKSRVTCNAICPGFIDTKMTAVFTANDKLVDQYTNSFPIQRVGQPEDMVGGVLYLSSDAAGFTTGTTLTMDGGHLA
jgi:NAD(P)-dependent dehydrogenase (short-subunit alcohol dehydrogenase family)